MSNWTQLIWAWVSACCVAWGQRGDWLRGGVRLWCGCGFRVWSGFDFLTCCRPQADCLPACLGAGLPAWWLTALPGCRLLYQHRRRRQLWKSTQAILLLACAPKMVYFPPPKRFLFFITPSLRLVLSSFFGLPWWIELACEIFCLTNNVSKCVTRAR